MKFAKVMFLQVSVCPQWVGMHGCRGACMVAGGACMVAVGVCMVVGGMHRIRQDTMNERVVCILLECILV